MARKLTLKQETFVLAYIESRNPSAAYKQAYDAEGMSAQAISVEAARLLKDPRIAEKTRGGIERHEIRAEVAGLLTLEQHMQELETLREAAKKANQLSAAITAEVKRGELRKFYVKQVETGAVGAFQQAGEADLDSYIAAEAAALGIAPPKSARH